MNKYYFDFLQNKLKKDIISELLVLNLEHRDIITKEIDTYFEKEITFTEIKTENGTHQVRDRSSYSKKDNRCKARIWNEGMGGQCSCLGKIEHGNFCKTHFNKGGEEWWLGTIDNPRPERPINKNEKVHYWLN